MKRADIEAVGADIERCMLYARPSLGREWRAIRKRLRRGLPASRKLVVLRQQIDASIQEVTERYKARPALTFPDSLPIAQRRAEIAELIEANQVCVICGETGSGKTTQLPKICLGLGRGVAGMIGHTQPRRIAARAVAHRIAEETQTALGESVGYKVRFSDHTGPNCHIKLMTDGILLAEIQEDRLLSRYDTLIIDEAHERSLNIDFLLGYLHRLLPRRPDLKVVITSATIDPERFARHFHDAPVLEVSGRTFPVEVRYRPELDDGTPAQTDQGIAILEAIRYLLQEARRGPGDILVFLAGEREIRDTSELLRKHFKDIHVLPLFARLSTSEQNRVFSVRKQRRIVLATNVAETSLTVPGIRYVIDPGLARISRYSYRSKIQRLPIEPVSQASANQRKGRCGRISDGLCVRLFSEEDFLARPEFTDPEILRTNLASVILQMETLGLGKLEDFPFVDAPDRRYISDGYRLLRELGAVDSEDRVTRLGRQLARFPVDPRIARMLVEAGRLGCLSELLVIASGLSIQDPRERPADKTDAADAKQAEFADPRSDFLTLVGIWGAFHKQRKTRSSSKLRRWCRENFLSYVRMLEWQDVYRQLKGLCKECALRLNTAAAEYSAIHRAVLAGLLSHAGQREQDKVYLGARNTRFHVFPGSSLYTKPPAWVVAASLMQTSRLFARTVAAVEPEWLEAAAGHLVKREYSEPIWDPRRGQVTAFERVSLFGLVLCAQRRVHYGPIEPKEARELFINGALVEQRWKSAAAFFRHNRALRAEIEEMEAKIRRRDQLVDARVIFDFYDERIPDGIYASASFERWRKKAERENPKRLFMTREFLVRKGSERPDEEQLPDWFEVGENRLRLEYVFEPGSRNDGVTLTVPAPLVAQLNPERLEWLVPGMIEDKVTAMIRALPKSLRRNFVPAPDFAAAAVSAMSFGKGSVAAQLSHHLLRMTGVEIPPEQWCALELPPHLHMNLRVVNEAGEEMAVSRDLEDLKGKGLSEEQGPGTAQWGRAELTDWDFDELSDEITLEHGDLILTRYPALRDDGESVSLTLCDDKAGARRLTHEALVRLFMLRSREQYKYLRKEIGKRQELGLLYQSIGSADKLLDDVTWAAFEASFLPKGASEIRNRAQFQDRLSQGRNELMTEAQRITSLVEEALRCAHAIRQELAGLGARGSSTSLQDMEQQLSHLVFEGFIRKTPAEWLPALPRYLEAMTERIAKLKAGNTKERTLTAAVREFWERLGAEEGKGGHQPERTKFRWMIEEYRVSLFAQGLGTAIKVSPQRLEKQWERVRRESMDS